MSHQPERSDDGAVVLRDPAAIKALTHPARLAVLDELFAGRELTATECAAIAGISPSAMSYHLRALARAGIVVPGTPSEDGRRRPWRAAGTGLQVSLEGTSTGLADARRAVTGSLLDQVRGESDAWISREEDQRWRDASSFTSMLMDLPLDQAQAFHGELLAVVERMREVSAERRPGSRRVRLAVLCFPSDEPPGTDPA